MTEKRLFKVVIDENTGAENIINTGNDKGYTEISEMCDKLNEQHENIERLKQKMEKVYNSLVDENEQLKKELEFWKKQAKHCPIRKW